MKVIHVTTNTQTYPIVITDNFADFIPWIKDKGYSKVAVISDSNVFPLYGEQVISACKNSYNEVYAFSFEAGESSKHIETMKAMYEFCITSKLDRKSVVIALGGGVTGDMVGFLAATFMRGISYIQMPTSLLAQVDSSVGGKTGIDFLDFKNVVGAFYQPELVYMNTNTLLSLPHREFSSGMGEVIKHGCILDQDYLDFLIKEAHKIRSLDHEALTQMIAKSCEIKRNIVNQDETEQGIRALLNFGHTFGHAIEKRLNFTYSHGACVGLGMACASYLSKQLGYINDPALALILNTLQTYELPIKIPDLNAKEIYADMFLDKKTAHNTLKLVLLKAIGDAFITSEVKESDILDAIEFVL